MQTEMNRSTQKKSFRDSSQMRRPDPDSILRDLLSQWWLTVLSALTVALLTGAIAIFGYTPTYASTTIFAIGTSGYTYSSSRIYANYTQAATTTTQFAQVVSSTILSSRVCERLGLETLDAEIDVLAVSSTNLMVLTVTADTPREAYVVSCAVKEEAVELMDYFLDGVTLMEIQKTNVPDSEAAPLELIRYMCCGMAAGAVGMLFLLGMLSWMRGTVKNREDAVDLIDAKLLGTISYEKRSKGEGRKDRGPEEKKKKRGKERSPAGKKEDEGRKKGPADKKEDGGTGSPADKKEDEGTGSPADKKEDEGTGSPAGKKENEGTGKSPAGKKKGRGREKSPEEQETGQRENLKESLLINNPMRSFAYVEESRRVGASVRIALDQLDGKVLMVTSTAENEGKTTVAANIALAISQQGKKVYLADLDFRKPALYKVFEQPDLGDRDFCESLNQGTKIKFCHMDGNPDLVLLLSKKSISSFWDRKRLSLIGELIQYMRERADYIILDTPPLDLVSDTEEYAAFSDACIMVVREDVVYATAINDTIDSLTEAGVKVAGCVLNASRTGIISRTLRHGSYGGYGNASYYAHDSAV